FAATDIPGKITIPSMRWYSMAGIMATSTSPRRKASAHCEGTVNDKSYLPASGPSVKPHTSGAVFRYSTTEMRNFVIGNVEKMRILNITQSEFAAGTARRCPSSELLNITGFARRSEL